MPICSVFLFNVGANFLIQYASAILNLSSSWLQELVFGEMFTQSIGVVTSANGVNVLSCSVM